MDSMTEHILAWYFLKEDRKLRYAPYTPVEPGQVLRVEGPLELCRRGLHASIRPLDALRYAPGSIVCRVEMGGDIIHGDDKLCASERKTLWVADATRTLHEFACWCAERALLRERDAGREPDPRSWDAVEAKRAWLRGEIDDKALAAAADAAWATAAAARAAVYAAAAAVDAAVDAAWAAAWAEQNAELERALGELAPKGK